MLSRGEKKVLLALKDSEDLEEISRKTNLEVVAVMRNAMYLHGKGLVEIVEKTKRVLEITEEGKKLFEMLPERKVLKHGDGYLDEMGLESPEIVVGWLKKRKWADISKKNGRIYVKITEEGKKFKDKKTLDEEFLSRLRKELLDVSQVPKEVLEILKRRKAVREREVTKRKIFLTEKGREVLKRGIDVKEEISQLTPEVIRSELWKEVDFKKFDIQAEVKRITPGKRHFVNQAIEYVRKIWLEMGFKEMTGPIVSTAFWCFDALFQPQDHPARDMQDTFFVKNPRHGRIGDDLRVERVKEMHERGGGISEGWRYKWSREKAKELVLRTHTTILSAKTLARLEKEELPAKFFSVGKCFRNEAVDWSHLAEFYQTDGIVVGDVNFRHLLGYLKEFLIKMGIKKFRFRPAYFPYTEPSVEVEVYDEKRKKWIELIGSGIFRPEVVVPLLGEDIPVLAWGPGFGRIMMNYYGIKDMRDLYKNDIEMLRRMKIWMG